MGNQKARAFAMQQEIAAEWKLAETSVRELSDDICIFGIGERRIQLIHAPSFEIGYSWDVRELGDTYRLFRSQVILDDRKFKLTGYVELDVDVDVLRHFLVQLRVISLPIVPDFSGCGGFDGTRRQLAFSGDLASEVRFQWWSEYPAHWQVLVSLADEMIKAFLPLPLKKERSSS
jgi:hypothetical protein